MAGGRASFSVANSALPPSFVIPVGPGALDCWAPVYGCGEEWYGGALMFPNGGGEESVCVTESSVTPLVFPPLSSTISLGPGGREEEDESILGKDSAVPLLALVIGTISGTGLDGTRGELPGVRGRSEGLFLEAAAADKFDIMAGGGLE